MAGAQTGTGKTAGFTLPLLQRLMQADAANGRRRVRALILTPTRELAAQVGESVQELRQALAAQDRRDLRRRQHQPADRRCCGAASTSSSRRRAGCSIIAQQRHLDLRHVEIFVLDEADRMLDMGFLPDIRRVIALLPQQRQSLLFSATFPDDIRTLANKLLALARQRRGRRAQRDRREDRAGRVLRRQGPEARLAVVAHRLRQLAPGARVHAHEARREHVWPSSSCATGFSAAAIHGNKSQGARTRALADFKRRRRPRARRDRHRGARARHRPVAARRELRPARGRRALCPPDRPHGPRRQRRPRRVARRRATSGRC